MTDQTCVLGRAEPSRVLALRLPDASFHATITPHSSLSREGERLLIVAIVAVAAGLVDAFALAGLWVVSIFLAFDALFVVAAVLAMRRRMRRREDVIVSPGAVTIRSFTGHALDREIRIEQYGMTVADYDDPDFGCLSLKLVRRGHAIEIARDLSPAERADFRRALIRALWQAGANPNISQSHGSPLAA